MSEVYTKLVPIVLGDELRGIVFANQIDSNLEHELDESPYMPETEFLNQEFVILIYTEHFEIRMGKSFDIMYEDVNLKDNQNQS